MPGVIGICGIGLLLGVYLFARKKGREQEARAIVFDEPSPQPPKVGEEFDEIAWWPEVWGPWNPEVPNLVVVDKVTDSAVAIYDWAESDRGPTVVGPGRGEEWKGK
jgi:hypothetical protein